MFSPQPLPHPMQGNSLKANKMEQGQWCLLGELRTPGRWAGRLRARRVGAAGPALNAGVPLCCWAGQTRRVEQCSFYRLSLKYMKSMGSLLMLASKVLDWYLNRQMWHNFSLPLFPSCQIRKGKSHNHMKILRKPFIHETLLATDEEIHFIFYAFQWTLEPQL